MNKKSIFLFLLLIPFLGFSQQDLLYSKIAALSKNMQGKVSVSASVIEDSTNFGYYGDELCVIQSVFKYPIALAILNKIDKGEFSLQHKMHVTPEFVRRYTFSMLRDSFYNGNINITFDKLIRYMVSYSDNIACDMLIHHLGKAKEVQKYLRKLGYEDVNIKYSEQQMSKKWENQYKNVCSPNTMVAILSDFFKGKILSQSSTKYLYGVMCETETGKNRMIKYLPKDTEIAHKTGSSGEKNGIMAAINDCGIIKLPNGKHLAAAIFVNDCKNSANDMEETIAKITLELYNYYSK